MMAMMTKMFHVKQLTMENNIMSFCCIELCNKNHLARGYCSYHYNKFLNEGRFVNKLNKHIHSSTCTVDDCNNKYLTKGFCDKHYRQFKRHGKIYKSAKELSTIQRFISKITVNQINGCHEWTDTLNSWGYGTFRVKDKKIFSHRFSYEYYVHKIPHGMLVCHSCDNPKCVNPKHLWIGTHADNMKDMVSKGRHASQKINNIGAI